MNMFMSECLNINYWKARHMCMIFKYFSHLHVYMVYVHVSLHFCMWAGRIDINSFP